MRINEPVGVVGIACPDEYPLLAFISLFSPAVVRGNTIVIIPSEKFPLSATDLYQVSAFIPIVKNDRDMHTQTKNNRTNGIYSTAYTYPQMTTKLTSTKVLNPRQLYIIARINLTGGGIYPKKWG